MDAQGEDGKQRQKFLPDVGWMVLSVIRVVAQLAERAGVVGDMEVRG